MVVHWSPKPIVGVRSSPPLPEQERALKSVFSAFLYGFAFLPLVQYNISDISKKEVIILPIYPNISERHKNMLNILRYIMHSEAVSANDITEATGLSFATISRVLASLQELNMIVKCGKSYTEMGRRPEMFSFNRKYAYLIHFFLNTDSVSAWISGFDNHIIAKATRKITQDITAQMLAQTMKELTGVLTGKLVGEDNQILAASIAVPGLVDDRNHVVRRMPNLHRLNGLNLGKYVTDALGVPVLLSNEARLCALGEKICKFSYLDDIIYIDITKHSGIGAGILLNGKIFNGNNGIAGEMGDIVIDTKNLDHEFEEQEGCLETLAGLSKLYLKCEKLLLQDSAPLLKKIADGREKLDFKMIEEAAAQGDEQVREVYDETIRMWSIAIINILSILDPELIILGGVLETGNEETLNCINKYVKKAVSHEVRMELSAMGEEAQLFGGLNMLSSYAFDQIISEKIINC